MPLAMEAARLRDCKLWKRPTILLILAPLIWANGRVICPSILRILTPLIRTTAVGYDYVASDRSWGFLGTNILGTP